MSKQDFKNYDAIFFSPHIDDAIFSCGGLISQMLDKNYKIAIINIFTKASDYKNKTKSIEEELNKTKFKSAEKLYATRKKFEEKIAEKIGIDVFFLEFKDGLFRKHENNFLYPSYKKLFSKEINFKDKNTIKNINKKILKIVKKSASKTDIYAPLGIGGHIDHLIVSRIIKQLDIKRRVIFWEDVPYVNNVGQKELTLNFTPKKIINLNDKQAKQKKELCEMYETQFINSSKTSFITTNFYKEVIYKS